MLVENFPLDFGGSTEVEGPTAVSRSLEPRSTAGDASAVASANGFAANGASAGSTALVPSYTFNLGGPPPTASPAVANGNSTAGNHAGSSQAVSAGLNQRISNAGKGAQAEAAGMEGGHELAASTMLSAFQAVDQEVQQAAKGLIPSAEQNHPAGDVLPAMGSDGALAAVAQAEADGAAAAVNGSVAPDSAAASAGASGHAAHAAPSGHAAHAAPSGSAATGDATGHAPRVAGHESAAGQAALPAGRDAAASSSSPAREAAGAAQAGGATQLPAAGPSSPDSTAQGAGSQTVSGKAGRHPAEAPNSSPESSEAGGHMFEGTGSPSALDAARLRSSSQAPPAEQGSRDVLDDALPLVSSSPPPPPALPPPATAGDAAVSDGAGGALQPAAADGLAAAKHALQQLQAKGKLPKPTVGKEAFKNALGLGLHHTQVSLVQLQPEALQRVRQGLQAKAGLDQLPPCVPMKQPAKGQPFQSVPDDEATPAFKVGTGTLGLAIVRCLGTVVMSRCWHNGLQLGDLFRMAIMSSVPAADAKWQTNDG